MYPKQTKSSGGERQHLFRGISGNSIYEFTKIDMPYMILYEKADPREDAFTSIEYSEHNKTVTHITYGEYLEREAMPLHFHDFYEITFVLSGRLTMQFEEEYVAYMPGDGVLSNKNIHHREIMDQKIEIVLFLLEESFVQELLDKNYDYDSLGRPLPIGSFFYDLFKENRKTPFYNAKEYIDFRMKEGASPRPLFELVKQMVAEITGRRSGKSYMMKALLCQLIEMIEDKDAYVRKIHSAKLSNEEEILRKISCAYENRSGVFSRAEMEALTGYNGDYIERIVKKHTGKTLSELGRSFLLRKAAFLLADTDMKIGEICEEIGYSNRNYFNRIFAKLYGVTPSEYRKQNFIGEYIPPAMAEKELKQG